MSEFTDRIDTLTLDLVGQLLPEEFESKDLKNLNKLLFIVICNLLLSSYYTVKDVQDFRVSAVEALNKVVENRIGELD